MLFQHLQRLSSASKPIVLRGSSVLRPTFSKHMSSAMPQQGISDMRQNEVIYRSLALSSIEDDTDIRQKYRPFILDNDVNATEDWVNNLDLNTALNMAEHDLQKAKERLRVLVLYGSLRSRSYSRLVAFEASRILFRLGCDVRVFDPEGLPVKNDRESDHPKVQELRELSAWSNGHVWVSPEQHGNLVRCLSLTQHSSNKLLTRAFCPMLDSSLQKPNRLDPFEHRKCSPNPGSNTSYCSGVWWISILQCRQLFAYTRSVDAHVYYPEPILDPEGLYTVPG